MYTKWCTCLFLVLFTCMEFYKSQKLDLPEGYDCHLPNNETGICKPLNQCENAIRELKQDKKSPLICSFQDILPVVCCKNTFDVEEIEIKADTSVTEKNQHIILSFIPYSADEDNKEGDSCNHVNGKLGSCEYVKNCNFQTKSIIRNDWNWCSHQLVCCHRKKPKHILACNIYRDQFNAEWIFDPDIEIITNTSSPNHTKNETGEMSEPKNAAAKFGEFQHAALIGTGTEENKHWICAGALISENFVLTAAHCVQSRRVGEVQYVRLGEVAMNVFSRRVSEDLRVRRIFTHPDYKRTVIYYDIALIELEENVIFTPFIHPACLHDDNNVPTKLNAIGWRISQDTLENNLLSTEININSYEECQSNFQFRREQFRIDNQTQICGTDEEISHCMNGSGAPIQVRIGTNLHSVVGVTSIQKSCGTATLPNVYTRISAYIPWIESVVWN